MASNRSLGYSSYKSCNSNTLAFISSQFVHRLYARFCCETATAPLPFRRSVTANRHIWGSSEYLLRAVPSTHIASRGISATPAESTAERRLKSSQLSEMLSNVVTTRIACFCYETATWATGTLNSRTEGKAATTAPSEKRLLILDQ
jgi:hypothetical protein